MLKFILATAFILVFVSFVLKAQTGNRDLIIKIAKADAKKFRLDKADWKKFRKNGKPLTADYFKPNKTTTSDTALLKDSIYVQTYRQTAYKKTRERRTVGHYVLTGYIISAAGTALIILLSYAHNKNSIQPGLGIF